MTNQTTAPARTPGPWKVHMEDQEGIKYLVVDESGFMIAKVGRDPTRSKSQAANARLIAAAPELLEACHALYTALCDTDIGQTPDDELDERQLDALRLYESATEKAEGR